MSTTASRRTASYTAIAKDVPQGLELGLRNYWYPVLQSEEVVAGKPHGFKVMGENLVAWRDKSGRPNVARAKCPHRAASLAAGHVLNGDIQCAWHGLRFNGGGRCTFIPWEGDDSKVVEQLTIKAYPAEEVGGYIWAFIGETDKFSVPPIQECVPEELLNPDEFIWFRMPTDMWKANWLQALESSDGYHAVMLHSDSQAVANENWTGGTPKKASVPLEQRRMQIVGTSQGYRGVALDAEGNPIHHGHFLKGWNGQRWTLPCLHTIPLRPVPNADPYASRLFQFSIDEKLTQSVRFLSWRATSEEQREQRRKLWSEVVYNRQLEVAGEDKMIIETLDGLTESRSNEFLLAPGDQDLVKHRHLLANAFLGQSTGARPLPGKEALVFPV
jgi:phenylpropionate dioxygenase-like ring-hydroxylating dioxygenase large terminal subunit